MNRNLKSLSLVLAFVFFGVGLRAVHSSTPTIRNNFVSIHSPAWSPRDNLIAFAATGESWDPSIWVINLDSSEIKNITVDFQRADYPQWSPDGQWVSFWANRQDLWIISPDGLDALNLTENFEPIDPFFRWSPDGQYIVFTSYTQGDTPRIQSLWVMRSDGSNAIKLHESNVTVFEYLPSWLPDGKQIVFTIINTDVPIAELWSINIDTMEQNLVATGLYAGGVSSPQDNKIAVLDGKECEMGYDLAIIDIDTSNTVNLTEGSCSLGLFPFQWSPDGRLIAYRSFRAVDSLVADIVVIDITDNTMLNLTEGDTSGARFPTWSPDSQQIAFESGRDGKSDIWVVNVDGSDPINLTEQYRTE